MRILAIETSGNAAGVAVLKEDKLEAEFFLNYKLFHSVILFPMIETVLKSIEISIKDIDAVVVSGGPGSFTGLRIGVSAAKGIAQGGNVKFFGISSLDAAAYQQVGFSGIICPVVNALRDNVYTCLYKWESGELIKLLEYETMHIDELLDMLIKRNEKVMFCADAVSLHKSKIIEKLSQNANFSTISQNLPRAASLGELALKRFYKDDFDDIYTYSPIYIIKPQAERDYDKKHGDEN